MELGAAGEAGGFNINISKSSRKEDEAPTFHVLHKVPHGDTPYVKAKHAQIVDKDPETSIVWFWKAINAGDRVDSALKDMAVVMKQLNRSEEAIEAIKSFRGLCSKNSQDSLDNVLIDLYKKCGKIDEQIELLKRKLRLIYHGEIFNGRPTKTARSHGKKFQVSVQQETSRLLISAGKLGLGLHAKIKLHDGGGSLQEGPDDGARCEQGLQFEPLSDQARPIRRCPFISRGCLARQGFRLQRSQGEDESRGIVVADRAHRAQSSCNRAPGSSGGPR